MDGLGTAAVASLEPIAPEILAAGGAIIAITAIALSVLGWGVSLIAGLIINRL